MLREQIETLMGLGAMRQSLDPLRRPQGVKNPHLIGFDSEFTQAGETLTLQFDDGEKQLVHECLAEPTVDDLRRLVGRFQDVRYDRRPVYLLTFFSPAELGRLGTFWKDERCTFRPVAPGIWDVTFPLTNRKLKSGRPAQPLCTIYDVFHLLLTSLGKAARAWGLPPKLQYDVTNLTRESVSDPDFQAYALYDATAARNIFIAQRELGLHQFGIDLLTYRTTAGFSMAALRRGVGESIGNPSAAARRQAMRSYWGAINSGYEVGDRDEVLEQWDCKSQYPNSAIVLGRMPRGRDWHLAREDDGEAIGGVCRATFNYPPDCVYPGLPVFIDGKLLFPLSGVSDCTLAEVRVARSLGADVKLTDLYVYHDGVTDLTEYLLRLMELKDDAEARGDEGARQTYKLMANAVVGKFGQHHSGTNLDAAFEFCERNGVSIEEFMIPGNFAGHPAKSKYHIGTSWLPEWATLILGYARSVMAGVLPLVKALNCTTDSYVCRPGLAVPEFGGLTFKLEGVFARSRFYRTRLYYLEDEVGGGPIKVAHHAIHQRKDDAYTTMKTRALSYTRNHGPRLPEAIRRSVAVDTRTEREMKVSWEWDQKRRLLPGGLTTPWKSVEEYLCKS